MDGPVAFVLLIVAVAFAFDFINGFHDSANSIATVVSTRVLSPGVAVLWAAFFNFIAAFTVGTAVAKTIGKGLLDPRVVDPTLDPPALLGAIIVGPDHLASGLPTLIVACPARRTGGAAIAKAGFGALILSGWVKPISVHRHLAGARHGLGLGLTRRTSPGCSRPPPGPLDTRSAGSSSSRRRCIP